MTEAKSSLRPRRKTILPFALAAVIATSVANPVRAETVPEVLKKIQSLAPAQRRARLEEGAKSEGQVVFYTSVSLTDYPKILAAFEQSYPYIRTLRQEEVATGCKRAFTSTKKGGLRWRESLVSDSNGLI